MTIFTILVITALAAFPLAVASQTPVTSETFVRAETDVAIKKVYDEVGLSTWDHNRSLTPIDKQNVIRMNRDTLYSFAIVYSVIAMWTK